MKRSSNIGAPRRVRAVARVTKYGVIRIRKLVQADLGHLEVMARVIR